MTAADVLAERLIAGGVEAVFGLPGDGINGIMEGLRTRQEEIPFVQVRHEESAAFMACGYAAEQALHFAESLARGEPNRGKLALTAISKTVRESI